jgi:hypothetical protein
MAAQAGYSGTPLAAKLGIRDGSRVLLVGAPDGLRLDLPPGVELHRRAGRAPYDVVLLFTPERRALVRRFTGLVDRLVADGGLWVAWPKRSSGVVTDLDEKRVREHGLASGLVDNKVCAIDQVWSGLRFVRRLRDR